MIKIREAVRADCSAIIDLRSDVLVAAYQKLKEPEEPHQFISAKDLEYDGFESPSPRFHCIVAEVDDASSSSCEAQVIGYAMYTIGYPIWVGKEISLQELSVRKDWQDRGVENEFLHKLVKVAIERNFARINVECFKDAPAAEFFRRNYGADMTLAEGWHTLRFDKTEFHQLAQPKRHYSN